ncbi:hypothetical protein C8Q70DRAFT_662692 [Cubamyces menziesii]|nr:hypothetical protein C8Q70DRAFT_662692 [Cubamyces menziesii]
MPSCVQCCAVLLLCCVVLLVLVAMPSFALEAPPRERLILQLDTYAMATPPTQDGHMRVGRNYAAGRKQQTYRHLSNDRHNLSDPSEHLERQIQILVKAEHALDAGIQRTRKTAAYSNSPRHS